MKFILSIIFCLLMCATSLAQQPNPRLKNFKYGTGKASWWEAPKATPAPQKYGVQTFYYPPAVRYYQPVPHYYYRHHPHCHCFTCVRRNQQIMMWQLRVNNPFLLFQFRF